jgi:hypothetical protein
MRGKHLIVGVLVAAVGIATAAPATAAVEYQPPAGCSVPCPPLHGPYAGINFTSSYKAGPHSVNVFIDPDSPGEISIAGVAKLGKAGKVRFSTVTQTVARHKISRFKLEFPARLQDDLKRLAPRSAHWLSLTITATAPEGQVTIGWLKMRLKGQR